jgi:hypothetical protein
MLRSNSGALIPMIRKSEWRLWFERFTLHASGRGFPRPVFLHSLWHIARLTPPLANRGGGFLEGQGGKNGLYGRPEHERLQGAAPIIAGGLAG